MHNIECSKQQRIALISLLLLCVISTSAITSVKADSTTLYLDWDLTDNTDVKGHLTLSDFPETMEINQTYRVEITLTLESYVAPIQNIGKLDFYLKLGSTEEHLGDCAVNSTLHRAESLTLYSNWKIEKNESEIPQTEGKLVIKSSANETSGFKIVQTIPQDITIRLKETSTLRLTNVAVKIFPITNPLNLVEEVSVDGYLTSFNESMNYSKTWSKISLTYLTPNGTEIIRQISTSETGHFADKFVPDSAGTWRVKATWNGTDKYSAASSSVEVFEVKGPNIIILPIVTGIFLLIILIPWAFYKYWPKKEKIYELKNESVNSQGNQITES